MLLPAFAPINHLFASAGADVPEAAYDQAGEAPRCATITFAPLARAPAIPLTVPDPAEVSRSGGAMGGLLEGKKVLVTGVLDRRSIAYSAARLAQEQGAEVVLSGFGRARSLTERTARRLDPEPPILELDVNKPEDIEAVAE